MANIKLSQIAPSPSNATTSDQFVGVRGGNTDLLFSGSQIVAGLVALTLASANLTFYVATTGSDSNPGTLAQPFRTIQRAVTVAQSYDYQALYNVRINVADGTYAENVFFQRLVYAVPNLAISGTATGYLVGNTTTPTNVKISPSGGASSILNVQFGAAWLIDGFSVVTDATAGGNDALVFVDSGAFVSLGNIDYDFGSDATNFTTFAILCRTGSFVVTIGTDGNNDTFTFQGTNGPAQAFMYLHRVSNAQVNNNWTFNSAINLAIMGAYIFDVQYSFLYIPSISFTNPGNVTGGFPFFLLSNSAVWFQQSDPAAFTWPGGAFTATFGGVQVIDESSTIDGWFYNFQLQAVPTPSNTYQDAWQIQKDPGTGRRYVTMNDGGSIHWLQVGRFVNTQTGVGYTLALPDRDGRVEMDNAGANTVTIDTNANVAFSLGDEVRITQIGAGATTIAGAVGVTVHNAGAVGGQWKSVVVYQRAIDEWVQTSV